MTPLRLISSMATRRLLQELVADHARVHGRAVEAEAAGGVEVARRLRSGERFDVVVLAEDALRALSAEGLVQSPRAFADSRVAVAAPATGPKPPIDTVEALRAALLEATAIGYSTGPSGDVLLRLLDGWGLHDRLRSRLRRAPPGVPVAALLASGDATLGVQQRSELVGHHGIVLLGDLPAGIGATTRFAASLGTDARAGAASLLDGLCAGGAACLMARHGMASPERLG